MESKSGFKECSRCGLRNKPSAKQCDFCGQKFDVADEWELQIDALEKLNRETKRVEVTKDVSNRIEATIIRKETSEKKQELVIKDVSREKEPERSPVVEKTSEPKTGPAPQTKEPTTVVTFTASAKPVEIEPGEMKAAIEEAPVVKIEETSVKEKAAPAVEVPPALAEPEQTNEKKRKVRKETFKHRKRADGNVFKWNFNAKDRKSVAFMLVLVIGIISYIASIAVSSSLGTIGSWSIVALSGLMIVVGTAQIAIDWNPASCRDDVFEHHEIVVICPNCNELVSEDDERCPSCGTEFEPSKQ